MNLEELTKTQIVLLVLLVSFVTSIATGIVTVSLLDQAPPALTQTINRIVERTVERVVPETSQKATAATPIVTRETTVVVKDEDLITQAIEKNRKSIVRIQKVTAQEAGDTKRVTVGLGVVVNIGGVVATDSAIIERGTPYAALTSDGASYVLKISHLTESPVALLTIQKGQDDKTKFAPVQFSDLSKLRLGQSVISFSGALRDDIQIGIIRSLVTADVPPEKEGEEPAKILAFIDTDVSDAVLPGTPLLNIFGEFVGIETGAARDRSPRSFSPNRLVTEAAAALSKQE